MLSKSSKQTYQKKKKKKKLKREIMTLGKKRNLIRMRKTCVMRLV